MKKLTAGIFTALLGLVTVNAANAAIPSTNYVDEKISSVYDSYQAADRSIREDFAAADTALGNRITTNANAIGTLTDLTTSAKGNTVAAINEVNEAIGTDAMGEIQTGKEVTDVVNPTTLTQAVNALNAKIDFKTSGIATDENLQALQNTVNGHTTSLNVLNGTGEGSVAKAETDAVATANAYTDQLANGQVKTNKDAIATNAAAIEVNTNAIAGLGNVYDAKGSAADAEAAAKAYADGLAGNYDTKGSAATAEAAAKSYADSLASNYDAAGAAATAKAEAATYTDGKIDALAETYETKANVSTAVQAAKDFASNAASQAETSANSYADEKLALKVDKAQGADAANHVVITDANGDVTTSATITQGQVSGLTTALDGKMPLTTTDDPNIGADGKYVLTATTAGGVTTYQWERIEREVTE